MAPFVSDKRLCLDSSGAKVVDCDSPQAATLLVGEGGELSERDARRYGLLDAAESTASKAVSEPPADKAIKGSANKARG